MAARREQPNGWRGPAVGVAGLAAVATVVPAEQAAAERIVVRNTDSAGKGSFAWATRKANSDADRDKIVFRSKLSGEIGVGPVTLKHSTALKRGRSKVVLRGTEPYAALFFRGADRISRPADPSTVRDMRLRDVGLRADYGVPLNVSDTVIRAWDGAPYAEHGVYGYSADIMLKRVTIAGFGTGVTDRGSGVRVEQAHLVRNGTGISVGDASATVIASTISGNEEVGVHSGYYGGAKIVNSTISGNGGVGVYGSNWINSSTITGNDGAIDPYSYDVHVANSIVAGNPPTADPHGDQCGPGVISRGGNVFGAGEGCPDAPRNRDFLAENPGLRHLAGNGGPTPTHALRKRSPAVGQAKKNAKRRDQRGVRRDRDPDSGAYERRR